MELYERIRDLLNDSVTEIFLKLQEEYKIECGDCPPDLEWDLNNSVDDLALCEFSRATALYLS